LRSVMMGGMRDDETLWRLRTLQRTLAAVVR
jgi:hypothetical protein